MMALNGLFCADVPLSNYSLTVSHHSYQIKNTVNVAVQLLAGLWPADFLALRPIYG